MSFSTFFELHFIFLLKGLNNAKFSLTLIMYQCVRLISMRILTHVSSADIVAEAIDTTDSLAIP